VLKSGGNYFKSDSSFHFQVRENDEKNTGGKYGRRNEVNPESHTGFDRPWRCFWNEAEVNEIRDGSDGAGDFGR